MSLRRPRNRDACRAVPPRRPPLDRRAQRTVADDPGHGVRPVGQDPRQRANEHQRRLGRAQPLDEADDGARPRGPPRRPEAPARGRVERRDGPQVDAGADDERLASRHRRRRQHADRDAFGEILPGHEHGGVAERAREPLEPDEERAPPVHGVVERPAVDRLERDRNARQARGQGREEPRLGRPRVHQLRPQTAQEHHQPGERAEVPRGRELADQARLRVVRHPARGDLRVVVALGPGVLAEDEVVVDGGEP